MPSVSVATPGPLSVDAGTAERPAAVGRRQAAFVYAFSALAAVVFSAASAVNYWLYLEGRLDLGNMVQVVWSTAHGHFLQMSDPSGAEMSRLGAHFDPFLALLAPLWWAWSNPILLLVAQGVAVASGALPVYWLARKHLANHGFAVVFAVAYLLYPPTQFNGSSPIGLHAVSFAMPLLLYAIWFLDNDRLIPFAAAALVAATTKEEIAAAVGGLGLWYAVRRGHRAAGLLILGLGLVVSIVNLTFVIPHFAPGGSQPFADRYSDIGGTPQGILHTLVTSPQELGQQVATWHKVVYVALILIPFLGLWALEPIMLAGAVPDLAINLLSSKPEQTSIFYQYNAGIVPFVVVASILGAARLRRTRYVSPALLATVGCLAGASPLVFTTTHLHWRTHAEIAAIDQALDRIPSDAPVSASNSLGAYVSERRSVAMFPRLGKATWVVVGAPSKGADDVPAFRRGLKKLRSSPDWKMVYRSTEVLVFERARL